MLNVVLIRDILCSGSTFYNHPRLDLLPLLLEMRWQLRDQVMIFSKKK